jgi:hypothetical protein
MTDNQNDPVYVRVTDGAGNQFLCPLEALKDPATASDQELENCVDDATAGRYAGNIRVKE